MADVSSDLKNWSATASSNSPSGSTNIGTNLDDNLREIQKVVRQDLATKGADIASATTTDVGAVAGVMHDITGTTTITGLGTVSAGIWKILKFEGALTLTHNATSLILPGGANITTADGDIGIFISEGSGNWRCVSYVKANGRAITSTQTITLGTEQASTSGTAIDFTGIPSGTKRITINFVGVSTNGSSSIIVQLGDSGGVETSGYLGAGSYVGGGGSGSSNFTNGFGLPNIGSTNALHGSVTLVLEDAANFHWCATGALADSNSSFITFTAGAKATSAELDRVRITMSNGTDAFDAGAINITYE